MLTTGKTIIRIRKKKLTNEQRKSLVVQVHPIQAYSKQSSKLRPMSTVKRNGIGNATADAGVQGIKRMKRKRQMYLSGEVSEEESERDRFERLNTSMQQYIEGVNKARDVMLNYQQTVMMKPFYMNIIQNRPSGNTLIEKFLNRRKNNIASHHAQRLPSIEKDLLSQAQQQPIKVRNQSLAAKPPVQAVSRERSTKYEDARNNSNRKTVNVILHSDIKQRNFPKVVSSVSNKKIRTLSLNPQ